MNVNSYIYSLIEKKSKIKDDSDRDQINYIEEGYIDSFGLIQFILDIEEKFSIEFSEEEMQSKEFRIVGELIKMVEDKIRDDAK